MTKDNKDGIFKNIIGVIISPKETLERVNENPRIWGYLIPITLIQLIITAIELPKLISFAISQAQQIPNYSQSTVSIMKTTVVIASLVGALIWPVLAVLIITAIIKLLTMFFKENSDFKNLFCLNILAYVPMILATILSGIIMAFTEPQDIKNISTNLTLVLSSSTDIKSTIYKLFSCIDFFFIWSLILVSIATSVAYKMKIKKAASVVFGLYVVGVIIRVLV